MTDTTHTTDTRSSRRRSRRLAGRPRVVAWIVAVTAVGLILMLVGVTVAQRVSRDDSVQQSIAQEVGEINRFSTTALDPTTGKQISSVNRFIELYLERQQAKNIEMLIGADAAGTVVGEQVGAGTPPFSSFSPDSRARILTAGSHGTLSDDTLGKVSWRTVELKAQDGTGMIAVIVLQAPLQEQARNQFLALSLIALAALAATGLVAWWASGRIMGHVDRFQRESVRALDSGYTVPVLPEEGSVDYQRLAGTANALTGRAAELVTAEHAFSERLAYELSTPVTVLKGAFEQLNARPRHPGHDAGTGTDVEETTAFLLPDGQEYDTAGEPGDDTVVRGALSEATDLEHLTQQLTRLARSNRPDYVKAEHTVDVGNLVTSYVAAFQHSRLKEAYPENTVVAGPNVHGALAQADPRRLEQVLDELVANALEASEPGAEVIVSSALATDRGGWERVLVDVTDSGRGIPSEQRAEVLAPFARADNDPTPGTGLGLAIADRLVHAMHGRILLLGNENAPGITARVELRPAPVESEDDSSDED